MPDYNKGDFTQQGYGGYVSGGLHLNEKRCLTAKISTDEQTSELDSVEINIHDHLNDLDYTITGENLSVGENALPSGNIVITENGENINVAPYATATVNVENNIPFCTITFVNNTDNATSPADYASPYFARQYVEYNENGYINADPISIPAHSSGTFNMLYTCNSGYYLIVSFSESITISDYVNCEDEDGFPIVIDHTQPCSFTATLSA